MILKNQIIDPAQAAGVVDFILGDFTSGHSRLPQLCQANDQSSCRLRFVCRRAPPRDNQGSGNIVHAMMAKF